MGPFRDIARDEPSLIDYLKAGDRSGVLHAVLDLLSRSLRPTILVIEDTHWADEATLDSIKFLGRRIARTNSLIVLTFRENVVDVNHPLRSVFADLPPRSLERIRLTGLSMAAVTQILSDSGLDPEKVWAATNGNPFFVTEMASGTGDEVPNSVRESVMARVGRLPQAAQRCIRTLSVVPERILRSAALELTSSAPADLEDCERLGLLRLGSDFVSFRHELIRRSIEASLKIREQVTANQTVLASLSPQSDPALHVHHARGAGDADAILKYAPMAAKAAVAIGSHREAAAHFETLGGLMERLAPLQQADLLHAWGRNQYTLGEPDSVPLLERAIVIRRTLPDKAALGASLTGIVKPYQAYGQPQQALDASEEAIQISEQSGSIDELVDALASAANLSLFRGNSENETVRIADRTIGLVGTSGNILGLTIAKQAKGIILASRGHPEGRLLLEQALDHARALNDRALEVSLLMSLASIDADFRRLPEAMELTRKDLHAAASHQQTHLEIHLKAMQSELYLWLGDWTTAEDTALEVVETSPSSEYIAQRVLGVLYARQGRAATSVLKRMWELSEESGERMTFDSAAAALAERFWITGNTDSEQLTRLREIVAQGIAEGSPWPSGALSFWMWKLGELPIIPESVIGPYQQSLKGDHLAAAEGWAAIGSPYEEAIARTHLDQANQLKALEMLESLGATAVAAKHRKAMRDQGMTVPRGKSKSTRSNVAGLTARQAEVLVLLAEGLTNNQIADRLFLSPRTVEHHVTSVLSKLDATARDKAVSTARDAGLLPT